MKKIISSCFVLLFTATIIFNNAIGNAYSNRLHQNCVDSRWKFITYEGDEYYFYDSKTLKFINKYIPFVDKKVEVWILLHDHKPISFDDIKTWRPRGDTKTLYLINLDDRTYQFQTTKTVITRSVVPGSAMEKVLVRCQELYDE